MSLDISTRTIIHKEKVGTVSEKIKNKEFSDIQRFSKCFNDTSLIKVLYALMTFKEMCVCDLAVVSNASKAITSHHLHYLKQHGLLQSKREGKIVCFSLKRSTFFPPLILYRSWLKAP